MIDKLESPRSSSGKPKSRDLDNAKAFQLADFVSFCLAIVAHPQDLQAKAQAMGLQDEFAVPAASGSSGMSLVVGRTTARFYKSADQIRTIGVGSTVFDNGEYSTCSINSRVVATRTDFESVQRTLDLDGDVIVTSPVVNARWRTRKPQQAAIIRATNVNNNSSITVTKFDERRSANRADPCGSAADHWSSAQAVGTIAAYQDHVARYANCPYAGLAKGKINDLASSRSSIQKPRPRNQ